MTPCLEQGGDHPWEKYEKAYDLEFGGSAIVAVQKTSLVQLVHVRAFP